MAALITQAQLENRIGAATVRRIYDDNGDGTADTAAVDQLLADASSKVRGVLGPAYDLALITPTAAEDATELTRICLDVAVALAAQRYPELVRRDWEPLMRQADRDLQSLRLGTTNLGTTAAPEPSNQTVSVASDTRRLWP